MAEFARPGERSNTDKSAPRVWFPLAPRVSMMRKTSGRSIVLDTSTIPTVGDIARYHADHRGERTAIHFEGRRLTFADLNRRSNQVANGLIGAGLGSQARIAVLSKNDPAFFELWLGAAKATAVIVPVNFRLAPPEVAYVLNDAEAEVLFVGADFYPVIERVCDELRTVRRIIAIDGDHPTWSDYRSWVEEQSTADPARADKRTRSKWSRAVRYAEKQKDEKEPLAEFVKRKGGINECVARYGRCLRRLAASRRSIAEFQRQSASKRPF